MTRDKLHPWDNPIDTPDPRPVSGDCTEHPGWPPHQHTDRPVSPPSELTDATKLRVLALWFDKWDETAYADRQAILDDESNPGKNGVQRDLRRIANELDAARAAPQADAGTLPEAAEELLLVLDDTYPEDEVHPTPLQAMANLRAALAVSSPATAGREE